MRWVYGLAWLPAVLAFFMGAAEPARAQAEPGAEAAASAPAFRLDVRAPDAVRTYLEHHLELQRYRELADLDDNELARLVAAAEPNARELLGTLGYFSPQIRLELQRADAGGAASRTVLIQVQPGEPVRVTQVEIEFSGAIATDPQAEAQRRAIRRGWSLPAGQPFTQAGWDGAKTQALRQLTSRRYPTGEVRASRAEIDTDGKAVRLSLTLDSGPAYRLGALQISGLSHHGADLVSRLARLTPGDDYDQARLLEAQQRLSDSGYFDSVFMTLDTAGNPGNAPVLVQLREAKLQKLVLGVGASTDSGARLSVEHTHQKLPGIGWRAVSKLSVDRQTQSLGTELTATPDADYWRWVTSALVQRQDTSGLIVDSERLRLGRTQSGERLDRNYYLQYDRARTTEAGVSTTADSLSANYAWTRRNFNNLLFPSRGYGLGVELGGGFTLGGSPQPFVRALTRWQGFWPLGSTQQEDGSLLRHGRLALRAEGGAVLAREGVELPSTQLFLTGGDNTVRGYGYRSIGVMQSSGAVGPGRYLAVGSVEWQRPILSNGRPTDWESTVFMDAGAVADKPGELHARVGVGAGARWRSPVGPLQVDLAYGVAVKKLRLHLSVGFSF